MGLNVSTMASGSVNSHTNAQGDVPGNWPTRRGFLGTYIYYPTYWLDNGYSPNNRQGIDRCCIAPETGTVFWMATYQYAGPGRYYYYGGPPITSYYYGAYGYGGTGVYGFNADMNGAVAQIHQPSGVANNTSSSNWALPHYMEVSRDGSSISYQYSPYYRYDYHHQEKISVITGLPKTRTRSVASVA